MPVIVDIRVPLIGDQIVWPADEPGDSDMFGYVVGEAQQWAHATEVLVEFEGQYDNQFRIPLDVTKLLYLGSDGGPESTRYWMY